MKYPFVSTTNAGDELLAATNGNPNNSLILDKAIFSSQRNTSNEPLEQTKESDFKNPLYYKLQTVKHNGNTMQPEVELDNKDFQQDYPVYMIGVLGHAQNDKSGNETLCAIAEANENPLIMPKATDNDYNCTFALPIGIDRGKNVNIITTEAGTVSNQDFKAYKDYVNSQLESSAANQSADSSSLTNISQSASYNYSNINSIGSVVNRVSSYAGTTGQNLSSSVSTNSSNITNLNNSYASVSSSVSANSSNISAMNGQLSNVANNTSVSTAISNVSNATNNTLKDINALSESVSTNSANIQGISNNVANKFDNDPSITFTGSLHNYNIVDLQYGTIDTDDGNSFNLYSGYYSNQNGFFNQWTGAPTDIDTVNDDVALFVFTYSDKNNNQVNEGILIDYTKVIIYFMAPILEQQSFGTVQSWKAYRINESPNSLTNKIFDTLKDYVNHNDLSNALTNYATKSQVKDTVQAKNNVIDLRWADDNANSVNINNLQDGTYLILNAQLIANTASSKRILPPNSFFNNNPQRPQFLEFKQDSGPTNLPSKKTYVKSSIQKLINFTTGKIAIRLKSQYKAETDWQVFTSIN